MIFKFLTLPFRIVFIVLRTIFYPWYLRWVFKLPWVLYLAAAVGVSYLAYEEYLVYDFFAFRAENQIAAGVPSPIKLSQWDASSSSGPYGEVNVSGLYFPALPGGSFDLAGSERGFILLADDQGREIKAALVVTPDEMTVLWDSLAAQGSGDRVAVMVNGQVNRDRDWARMIDTQLQLMRISVAADLVVIEPYIGDRALAIRSRTQEHLNIVIGIGVIAMLLVIIGIGKMAADRSAAAPKSRTSVPAKPSTTAHAGAQKIAPNAGNRPAPQSSSDGMPWGSAQPQPLIPADASDRRAGHPAKPRSGDVTPAQPKFKSVFPGGGSAFRFKSADEIIRQSFGTLSRLKPSLDRLKAPNGEE